MLIGTFTAVHILYYARLIDACLFLHSASIRMASACPSRLMIKMPISHMLHMQLCSVRRTAAQAKNSMESSSGIHPAITVNTEYLLVKHVSRILICKSHNASISVMSNSLHNIIAVRSASYLALKPYCVIPNCHLAQL